MNWVSNRGKVLTAKLLNHYLKGRLMSVYSDQRVDELTKGGQVRRISRWGEEVMHRETKKITVFDDELRQIARDMYATMQHAEGVGLAATQIGLDISMAVITCPDADGHLVNVVICNPVVSLPEGKARHLDASEEGCLSFPGAYQPLSRPDVATCKAQNPWGEDIELTGTGLLARCLQHETDHLYGTVFGDRLSNRSRKLLEKQHLAVADRYADDWPITPLS